MSSFGRSWVFRATADARELGAVSIDDEEQTVSIGATVARKSRPKPAPGPDDPGREAPKQLREKLSDEEMQVGLNEAKQAAKACGAKMHTLMPEATIQVKVGGDGEVETVMVQPPARGTAEAACIVTQVSKLKFSRSRTGGGAIWNLKLY